MKMHELTYEETVRLNRDFASSTPQDILRWAVESYGDGLTLASSFGAEDVVLIDMLSRITENPRVFVLDTGRLHQETYDVIDNVRKRYCIEIETFFPQTDAVERLLTTKGPNSFRESVCNRRECCFIRKVEPLNRALSLADAWVTGLRRSQSVTRADLQHIEIDGNHRQILKINPLLSWSEDEVWEYIKSHDVPYNALHDIGFPSIGCQPCTRAIQPNEDLRAGRWWWEMPEHKECGLHIKDGKVAAI